MNEPAFEWNSSLTQKLIAITKKKTSSEFDPQGKTQFPSFSLYPLHHPIEETGADFHSDHSDVLLLVYREVLSMSLIVFYPTDISFICGNKWSSNTKRADDIIAN